MGDSMAARLRAATERARVLETQNSILRDLVGVMAMRMPGDDVVRVTTAERKLLEGKHLMLTPDGQDLLINIVTPQEAAELWR